MAKEMKRKRGRPPKPAAERRRHVLGLRIRDETKARLQAAADRNQRTMTAEAEERLERSLEVGSFDHLSQEQPTTYTVLLIVASVLSQTTVNVARFSPLRENPPSDWTADPYIFDQAVKAVMATLKALRPPGKPSGALPVGVKSRPGAFSRMNLLGCYSAGLVLKSLAFSVETQARQFPEGDARRHVAEDTAKWLRGGKKR